VKRLAGVVELLDWRLDDPRAIEANLRDLRRINRLMGGAGLSSRALDSLIARAIPVDILDVGTGGADIPLALLARARHEGRAMQVTAVDSRREIIESARALDPRLDRVRGLSLGVADGLALPYSDGAFDVGHSSLVIHHLEPADAITFLRELRRVSRVGIIVNDLVRAWVHWLGALALTRTYARSQYTRNDGPLSVRRAYTLDELQALINEAGMTPAHVARGFAGHRYAVAAR
jgi:ubiquinone/menaquinone biosynthesis C-methylase UbiE